MPGGIRAFLLPDSTKKTGFAKSLQEKRLDKHGPVCYTIQALRGATQYRGVEQLAARRAHNPEVVGSSPASATIKTPGIHHEYRDFSNFLEQNENGSKLILEQFWNSC